MRVMATCETEGYQRVPRMQGSTFVLAAALVAHLPTLRALRRIDVAYTVRERVL